MMKRRLKVPYLFLLVGILGVLPAYWVASMVSPVINEPDQLESVNEEIPEINYPVLNSKTRIISPYIDNDITIGKNYYDYQGEEEKQIASIHVKDNMYIQNTGIDYVREKEFDVVAILDGTVVNVKEDDLFGKTIEIKHENDIISIYKSLGEISVKKDDIITQGQVIGKSGTNEIDKDLGNHLHFEIYHKGNYENPENYINKEVEKEKEN